MGERENMPCNGLHEHIAGCVQQYFEGEHAMQWIAWACCIAVIQVHLQSEIKGDGALGHKT